MGWGLNLNQTVYYVILCTNCDRHCYGPLPPRKRTIHSMGTIICSNVLKSFIKRLFLVSPVCFKLIPPTPPRWGKNLCYKRATYNVTGVLNHYLPKMDHKSISLYKLANV